METVHFLSTNYNYLYLLEGNFRTLLYRDLLIAGVVTSVDPSLMLSCFSNSATPPLYKKVIK